MRSLVPKLLIAALLALAALVPASVASAAPAFSGAFKLTGTLNTNNKIVAGPEGNMWFTVATAGKDVAKITPTGEVTEYELSGIEGGTGIALGPEGNLWIPTINKVTRFSPADPAKTAKTFTINSIASGGQIAFGPNGEFWVASLNDITHFSPVNPEGVNGSFTPVGQFTPLDIEAAGSGLVVADQGHGRLVTVGADGKQGPDIPLGGETMTSQGVAGNPNGQIAFSKSDATEGLGLVTPPAPPTAVLMMGDPFGATLGPDGAYWFAMSAAHGLERLTATGEATPLPFVGFEKWFPRQIAAGPNDTIWATMEVPGENEFAIALVSGVEPAPPTTTTPPPPPGVIKVTEKAVPNTVLGKHPKKVVKAAGAKASVKFTFSSTVPGSTFQCKLVKPATGKKKRPKAVFVGCRSPKVLRLAPGKYRFAVRAVADGVIDGTPVESKFRVVRAPRHR